MPIPKREDFGAHRDDNCNVRPQSMVHDDGQLIRASDDEVPRTKNDRLLFINQRLP